jgi:glycosyltransferase involved in cell wall biosynthesis
LSDIYERADCLLNLSFYEGMSNVVLEAMAHGLPVIASKVPGNTEVVEDKVTGFLVDINSSCQFQSVLKKIALEPGLSKKMGENGRKRVETFFGWEQSASKYENLFSV